MARNYSGQQPRRPTPSSSQTMKQWIWVIGAFAAGYFISALYDVASFRHLVQTTLIDGYFKQHPSSVVLTQAPVTPPKPKLEFYTLLAKGEQAEVQPVAAAASTPPVNHAVPASVSSPLPMSTSANKPDPFNSPVKVQAAPVKDLPVTASAEHYTVQLAAFGNRSDAEKMKASFLLKGFNVSLVVFEKNHTQWYRVILGPFANRGEAEDAQHSVAKRERVSGMIRKASA